VSELEANKEEHEAPDVVVPLEDFLVGVDVALRGEFVHMEDPLQVAHDVDGREKEKSGVIDLGGDRGTGGRGDDHISFDDLVVSLGVVQEDGAADVVASTEVVDTGVSRLWLSIKDGFGHILSGAPAFQVVSTALNNDN